MSLSKSAQRLYNERSKNLLEAAIAFWEASPEGRTVNEAFTNAKNQIPDKITKIVASGLPTLPDIKKGSAPAKFEDLDPTQRIPYLLHAAVISLKRVLKSLTDTIVEAEMHSMEYNDTTQRFLKSRYLHVLPLQMTPTFLDQLAARIDGQTVIFAPKTGKHFKTYINCKAKERPAAVIWDITENGGAEAELFCFGPPDRWCSVFDMVTTGYTKTFCSEYGGFGSYEVCIKKRDSVEGSVGVLASQE